MRHAAVLRGVVTLAVFLLLWWAVQRIFTVPAFLLPPPQTVAAALWTQRELLAVNAGVTGVEILLGLLLGSAFGALAAILVVLSPVARRWLQPLLVVSQAIPVFAIAPLAVLWLGFGIASKVLVAVLVIFFPVAAAFSDGLRRTEPGLLDLAQVMGAGRLTVMRFVRLPAALPALGSGLRIAAAVAPIGAILGEWVGASSGLGYVMIDANARMRTDVMFAALAVLAAMALAVWGAVDFAVRRLLYWVPEQDGGGG